MSDSHAQPIFIAFYPTDWLAGTRGMTPAETGVYITLIAMMYERGRPLGFDRPQLARLCNCPAGTLKKILTRLIEQGKTIEVPEGLWHKRVEEEINKARSAIDTARERGKKGADARWSKDKGLSAESETASVGPESREREDEPYADKKISEFSLAAMHEQCISNTTQSHKESKINKNSSSAHGGRLASEGGTSTSQKDSNSTLVKLTNALGYASGHCPPAWLTPDAALVVASWENELGLTPGEIVDVATSSARGHGSPARYPSILTEAMSRYAAQKQAPPLTPHLLVKSPKSATPAPPTGHGITPHLPEKYRR